nr:PadR family transcriptional regulator [uncultured Rhodopila sp.]
MHHHRHHRHDGGSHAHGGERRFSRGGLPLDAAERHGRHRHGGGRHRLFNHGDLRLVLLSMIADKPAQGCDLIKTLEDRIGGGCSPGPEAIYPTLTLLEEQGFVGVTAEAGRKLYQATPEAEAYLRANQAALDAIRSRIDAVAQRRSAVPAPQIVRAVENLKTALRLRLAGEPMTDDRVQAIAAAIDAAAVEAERA